MDYFKEILKMNEDLINIIEEKDKIIQRQDKKIDDILQFFDSYFEEINNKWLDSHPDNNLKYYGQIEIMQMVLKILCNKNM